MKLKKALSGILAAAMVVSLTPTMAFASTTNTVSSVPTVATDAYITTSTVLNVKNLDAAALESGKIKLSLSGAKFETSGGVSLTTGGIGNFIEICDGRNAASSAAIEADVATDTSATISFTSNGGIFSIPHDGYMTINIKANCLKTDSDAGEVTLSIDGLDSRVSSGTYTIAVTSTGATIATVSGDVKTLGRGVQTPKTTIELTETSINSLKASTFEIIKMTLPKGYKWTGLKFAGDMANTPSEITGSAVVALGSTTTGGMTANTVLYTTNDDRTAYLKFAVKSDNGSRQTLTLNPSFNITKDAAEGEITVDIVGVVAEGSPSKVITDAAGLVIAKYGNESVAVNTPAEADLPTIVAGRVQDKNDKDFTVKIQLKENMKGALIAGKTVDFEFPEEVQLKDTPKVTKNFSDSATAVSDKTYVDYDLDTKKDCSTFSFTVPKNDGISVGGYTWKTGSANTITFELPVTVDAEFVGDITLAVKGSKAGVDECEMVVAKVVAPITVTATTTDIKTGVQTQSVSDITIVENIPGYLKDKSNNNELVLGIDTLGLSKGMSIEEFDSVEVTAGNLSIGKAKTNSTNALDVGGDAIIIPIKDSSTVASTIEIKGVKVSLNRTLPEGGYDLLVGGSCVVDNSDYNDSDFSGTAAKVADYVNIVTPAESTTVSEKVDAKFVIGEASYTNNGAATEMDAAAYIDSHNRTMVPIRYVANACGISENDIRWEAGSQTAIINGLNTVVTVKMGSNKLQTSTGEITMDTVAVNNNGRIYVPVRYIANALGANVSWDAATKTVTLTK